MKSLLISACLLGVNCKYSGENNCLPPQLLESLRKNYILVPVCPETAGGLPIPRAPSERQGSRVVSKTGSDVTAQYEKGAQTAVALAKRFGCAAALLKEKSPSCGAGKIYDGSFSATLVTGNGVAAERLLASGIPVFGESEVKKLL